MKIYACGEQNRKNPSLNFVESFSWPENVWTPEPAMNGKRLSPTAFVYQGQIYLRGGWNGDGCTDSIERLDVGEDREEWIESLVKMSSKCNRHGMVCCENTAILTGGRDGDIFSDRIYEIELVPPYTMKLLTQMPERRCYHGCQVIDNEVVVAGG